jgi:hypothetical protein
MLKIIFVLGIMLTTYRWGKCRGAAQGYKAGMAAARFDIRQESLEKGYCILCKNPNQAAMTTVDESVNGA